MDIPFYQVDAFSKSPFGGNPAAVCILKSWPSDSVLLKIAAENNLSETAFIVVRSSSEPTKTQVKDTDENTDENTDEISDWDLRWFTPTVEIDLCGHATLATAHVLFKELKITCETLRFHTLSGVLEVIRSSERTDFPDMIEMLLPPIPVSQAFPKVSGDVPQAITNKATDALKTQTMASNRFDPPTTFVEIEKALDVKPIRISHSATNDVLLVEMSSAEEVAALSPNMQLLEPLSSFGLIATAAINPKSIPANFDNVDFVSRVFAPAVGIPEDPVTGAAHCSLVPYWSEKLGKSDLHCLQISARQGELFCRNLDHGISISGQAVTLIRGTLTI